MKVVLLPFSYALGLDAGGFGLGLGFGGVVAGRDGSPAAVTDLRVPVVGLGGDGIATF